MLRRGFCVGNKCRWGRILLVMTNRGVITKLNHPHRRVGAKKGIAGSMHSKTLSLSTTTIFYKSMAFTRVYVRWKNSVPVVMAVPGLYVLSRNSAKTEQ